MQMANGKWQNNSENFDAYQSTSVIATACWAGTTKKTKGLSTAWLFLGMLQR
jgi:hypothetical protein